ncbi:Crp/Fnr family transcriptional regulator [Natranaerovirga pectinivora]|uniref:Crp/Fnr family transcriptional regulator n=1 Tax=Natranaerovirga pectinivora TaxID=682400 RepID=A0A4R3MGB5_9FIRM|nr:Crp/Fnr family transcriptional regulator [Natranaerovirga pectinivora]TCT12123.1 Crp/Fnr family transcriptional regulator [Natranaerovirga pectinivora]
MLNTCNCSACNDKYCAKKVSLFSNLDTNQILKVVNKIDHKSYKKGEILFSEGDIADRFFIVNKGSLKVYNYTKDGKEQILYILSESDFLGDLNLFKEGVFDYYAMALEDTALCTLNKQDFNHILLENPEINLKILDYAYERITTLEKLIQTLNTKDINTRLANLLINISKNFGIKKGKEIEITLPLSREDMASYLGLTRETVSRHLSDLQNQNIIKMIGNKKMVVLDMNELNNL